MRTVIRFGALSLAIAAGLGAWWRGSVAATAGIAIRHNVEVQGATPGQLAMARWAVGRFEVAGLTVPAVDIEFHADGNGCGGHLGFARSGQVDVCSVLVNAMSRRTILHEMSHVWLDQNVGMWTGARFVALRGLPSWNSRRDPWRLRGYEQGAEIISWALGERILTAQIPNNDPVQMTSAFELLTGRPLP